jgi:periplasmic copper chaperone A
VKDDTMKKYIATGLASIAFAAFAQAHPLHVDEAWIRPAVAGQQGTGGFMLLKSKQGVTITGVSVPLDVGVAELHEMKMDGDVMRMKAIDTLAVPAGQTVALKPGGYHLMLVGLKAPLPSGSQVPVTFRFKDAQGTAGQVKLDVPVAVTAPSKPVAPSAASEGAAHKHAH